MGRLTTFVDKCEAGKINRFRDQRVWEREFGGFLGLWNKTMDNLFKITYPTTHLTEKKNGVKF